MGRPPALQDEWSAALGSVYPRSGQDLQLGLFVCLGASLAERCCSMGRSRRGAGEKSLGGSAFDVFERPCSQSTERRGQICHDHDMEAFGLGSQSR